MRMRTVYSVWALTSLCMATTGCPEPEPTPLPGTRSGVIGVVVVDEDGNETERVESNGVDYAVLEVLVKDADNKPWQGDLTVGTDRGAFGVGFEAQTTLPVDATGAGSIRFYCAQEETGDPEEAGVANITLRNTQALARIAIRCTELLDYSSLSLEGPSATFRHYADGFSEVPLTASVLGLSGQPVQGTAIVFRVIDESDRLIGDNGLVDSLTRSTNQDGLAVARLRAPATPMTIRVEARWENTPSGDPLSQELALNFEPSSAEITLYAERSALPADGATSVTLHAAAKGDDGAPLADGASVRFRVNAPYSVGTPAATATVAHVAGGTGEATVTLNTSSTVGVATIIAESVLGSGQRILSSPVSVNYVTPGSMLLIVEASPDEIYSDEQDVSFLTVTVVRDGAPIGAGQRIYFDLTEQDAALATFGIQGAAPSTRHEEGLTDQNGQTTVELRGFTSTAAGTVTVVISTQDAQNGNADVIERKHILIKRHPLLQSVIYVGAEPNVLGVRGSSRASTAVVRFMALNDNNEAMPDVKFTFLRPITIDPEVTVTTAGGGDSAVSDGTGTVTAYLSAGEQAHPVRVIAQAQDPRLPDVLVTVTSDAIPITSGLASFTHSWFVCDIASAAVAPPASRECVVMLADRFSERVVAGTSVQLRVESGNITPAVTTDSNGSASGIEYLTGQPAPSDTPDANGILGNKNPTDQLVSMLAYTRGEEPFTDLNGNGSHDTGEPFVDFPEPFVDKQDNCVRNDATNPADEYYIDPAGYPGGVADPYLVLQNTDSFIDGNNDGVWNGPNGIWDNDTLIWFQDWTLGVHEAADLSVVDAACPPGSPASDRCDPPTGHLPWLSRGERIVLRFVALDLYGNCPAPGVTAQYIVGVNNATGGGDFTVGRTGCGLDTARYGVDPSTGHVQPFCGVYSNLVRNADLSVAQEGLGSHSFKVVVDTTSSTVGEPIDVEIRHEGVDLSGQSIVIKTGLTFLVPCTEDDDCSAASCREETGLCMLIP